MYASYVDDHAARALKHPWCRLLVAWAIIPMPVNYIFFLFRQNITRRYRYFLRKQQCVLIFT